MENINPNPHLLLSDTENSLINMGLGYDEDNILYLRERYPDENDRNNKINTINKIIYPITRYIKKTRDDLNRILGLICVFLDNDFPPDLIMQIIQKFDNTSDLKIFFFQKRRMFDTTSKQEILGDMIWFVRSSTPAAGGR